MILASKVKNGKVQGLHILLEEALEGWDQRMQKRRNKRQRKKANDRRNHIVKHTIQQRADE